MKKNRGFTLLEILSVIAVIIILMGLLYPALSGARESAKKRKAEAMIGALEVAINMYYTDYGSYPSDSTTWESTLVSTSGSYGPYMDTKDYDSTSGDFLDPWGNLYRYDSTSSTRHNTATFDVWSYGPNGSSGDTSDDIGNW